jgi:hypothetical protein
MSFNNFMTSNYNSYYPGISNTIKGATKWLQISKKKENF